MPCIMEDLFFYISSCCSCKRLLEGYYGKFISPFHLMIINDFVYSSSVVHSRFTYHLYFIWSFYSLLLSIVLISKSTRHCFFPRGAFPGKRTARSSVLAGNSIAGLPFFLGLCRFSVADSCCSGILDEKRIYPPHHRSIELIVRL